MRCLTIAEFARLGEIERKYAAKRRRRITDIRHRYTRVTKIGDRWNAYLQIDHQGFCVVEQTTKKRAEWFACMLAVALAGMMETKLT